MPGIVRLGDAHAGHASPTPSPFHQTSYASASGNVLVNGKGAVRVGDTTGCGDPAVGSSPNVKVCLLYTSPSPRDQRGSRMPSSA